MLARAPGMTAVAVLALGIGVNTALFSVVNAVLLRPLPVKEPERLVSIVSVNPRLGIAGTTTAYARYAEWRKQARSFESMAAAWAGAADVTIGEETERAIFWRVSESFLPLLRVLPFLGRGFLPEEDQPGGGRVALLSYAYWHRRFAAARNALGQQILIEGNPHAVVGVLPEGFHVDGRPAEVYAPIALSTAPTPRPLLVSVYARLKPDTTILRAQAEMDAISRRQDRGFGWGARVWDVRDAQVQDVRLSLLALLGAVGLVLLLACTNVASLLVARANARQEEIAVRAALGASRGRLARQFLTESALLALAGGACGVALAGWSVRLVPLIHHERLPGLLLQTRVDGAVLAFTLGLSLLTGMVFGAAPAWSDSRANLHETLKEGVRVGMGLGRGRFWNALVIIETALAVVLIIGAVLLIRAFFFLRDEAPGFRVDGLLVASLNPPRSKYAKAEQFTALYQHVMERVRAIPGVQFATLASALPLSGDYWAMSLPIEGHHFARPQDYPILWYRAVDRDYFRTLQIPLLSGRFFDERDRAGAPRVAIINEAMARRFWPGERAVGKHLGGKGEMTEIVGVVGNMRHMDVTKEPPVEVFFHWPQAPPPRAMLAVRADPSRHRGPTRLVPAVTGAVAAVDEDVMVVRASDMQRVVSDRIAPKRLTAGLIAAFAALALVLAGVGTYGVLSFSVAQRTHEMGVRIALGAPRGAVLGLVTGQAALLALAGVLIGLGAALGATRVIASLLFGVSAADARVFAGVSLFLLAVAVLAALVPACRAARVDPVTALRRQ